MKEFREAGLREEIIDAISEMGFVKPNADPGQNDIAPSRFGQRPDRSCADRNR